MIYVYWFCVQRLLSGVIISFVAPAYERFNPSQSCCPEMITPEIIRLYRHCTKFKAHPNAGNLVSTHPADQVWYKPVIPFGGRTVTFCALSCNNGRRHSRNKIVRRLASRARCCHFCDGACDVLFTILPPGSSNTCRPGPMA